MYDPNKCQSKKVQERLAALNETEVEKAHREYLNKLKARRRRLRNK